MWNFWSREELFNFDFYFHSTKRAEDDSDVITDMSRSNEKKRKIDRDDDYKDDVDERSERKLLLLFTEQWRDLFEI